MGEARNLAPEPASSPLNLLFLMLPQDLRYSVWPASGQMFPKLRLKHKPNLISLAGGMEGLPITRPEARATPLEPAAWKQMIAQAEVGGQAPLSTQQQRVILKVLGRK